MAKNLINLFSDIVYKGLECFGRFYSEYEGIVVDNVDPKGLNRVKVIIPRVYGNYNKTRWAKLSNNYSGPDYGINLLPSKNSRVLIKFEFGDSRFPMWSHGQWGNNQKPEEFSKPSILGIKTPNGTLVTIDDENDIISIKTAGGNFVELDGANDIIKLNGVDNEGLVKVQELTDRFNELKSEYDAHVHTSNGPGNPTLTPINGTTLNPSVFPNSLIDDFQNEKVKH